MDNAHSIKDQEVKSTGTLDEIQKLKSENAKLKEDHEKQIQALKLENRIAVLELEKENQNLKHEMELMQIRFQLEKQSKSNDNFNELKLQNVNIQGKQLEDVNTLENEICKFVKQEIVQFKLRFQYGGEADCDKKSDRELLNIKQQNDELQKKVAEIEEQLVDKDGEIEALNQDLHEYDITFHQRIQDMLDVYQSQIQGLEEKLEDAEQRDGLNQATIQKLQSEIEALKTHLRAKSKDLDGQAKQTLQKADVIKKTLVMGLELFFLPNNSSSTQSYQLWYNDVRCSLKNLTPRSIRVERKLFILLSIQSEKECENIEILTSYGVFSPVPNHTSINGQKIEKFSFNAKAVKLLHPIEFSKSLSLVRYKDTSNAMYKWTGRIGHHDFGNAGIFVCTC